MTSAQASTLPESYGDIVDLIAVAPAGDEKAVEAIQARDAQLTKPAGSLGALETLVEHLARWQRKADPKMENPMVAIFAGNHGVTNRGVSPFPQAVTAQMVQNFTDGGAAISQICGLHEINLRVFELALELPTGDLTIEPAMDDRTCAATIAYGMEAIAGDVDVLGIGEMGIGNTTVAAVLFAALFGGTGADWVGRGTGVDDAGLQRKIDAVNAGLALHASESRHPLELLARLGGREIAAMLGAIIATRHRNIPVFIDGFVATSAAAVAHLINPAALDHCIFGHVSAESHHSKALEALGKKPLLDMGMRLGEGTGAALGMAMAKTALHLHNNMATFESASVANKAH